MGGETEELKFELLEAIEDAYRMPKSVQIFLFVMLEIIMFAVLYHLQVILQPYGFVAFLLFTGLIYPMVIKVRNFITEMIAVVLYGAIIFSVGWYVWEMAQTAKPEEIWMIVIFLLVFGVELFHHMYEKARTVKTPSIIIADLVLAGIFAFATFMLLQAIKIDIVWSILVTIGATVIYAYAILPEKPY